MRITGLEFLKSKTAKSAKNVNLAYIFLFFKTHQTNIANPECSLSTC